METNRAYEDQNKVTSREGRVSRNFDEINTESDLTVTSREGRVSRNPGCVIQTGKNLVTSREGRVSRNLHTLRGHPPMFRHVP